MDSFVNPFAQENWHPFYPFQFPGVFLLVRSSVVLFADLCRQFCLYRVPCTVPSINLAGGARNLRKMALGFFGLELRFRGLQDLHGFKHFSFSQIYYLMVN